jgi:hypothetical protein
MQNKLHEITWSEHWRRVSSRLRERGYSRTPNACNGHWKRCPESQKANDAAAGHPWDNNEHSILVRRTKDQLAQEEIDPLAVVSWGEHWSAVSLQLQEYGYNRPAHECDAYWNKVEDSCSAPSPGINVETRPLEAHSGASNENERYSPDRPRVSTNQLTGGILLWTDAEHENLLGLVKNHYNPAEHNGPEELWDERLWSHISQIHQQNGYNRTWEDCKRYWQTEGRFLSGLEKCPGHGSGTGKTAPLIGPKSYTHSTSGSKVIEVEQDLRKTNLVPLKRPNSTNFQKAESEPEESDMSDYEPNRPYRQYSMRL